MMVLSIVLSNDQWQIYNKDSCQTVVYIIVRQWYISSSFLFLFWNNTIKWCTQLVTKILQYSYYTRRFLNHESRLLSRAHTFAIIVILDLKIHQSMWIHWSFFPKSWTRGHWPLHDLWPHVCWGHMCDSTQGSLCPSSMTIHQCMWIQWSILQITTYIHIHTTYIHTHTYYVQNEWSHSLLLNSVQARQKWKYLKCPFHLCLFFSSSSFNRVSKFLISSSALHLCLTLLLRILIEK